MAKQNERGSPLARAAHEVLRGSCTRFAEVQSALMALLWAVWLALPLGTFTSSQSYRHMAAWAPEWVWAAFFGVVGSVQLTAVLQDAMRFNPLPMRRVCAWVSALIWLWIGLLFLYASPASLAGPTFAGVAVGLFWAWFRLSGWGDPPASSPRAGLQEAPK